jgi:hypothetical protein
MSSSKYIIHVWDKGNQEILKRDVCIFAFNKNDAVEKAIVNKLVEAEEIVNVVKFFNRRNYKRSK